MSSSLVPFDACTSHGTWYPATIENTTLLDSNINGTCVCDMFWVNEYCSEASLEWWYPFHWTFIGLWSCTGAAQLYFVCHLIYQLLSLRMSLRNVQLLICLLSLGSSIGGIVSSLHYIGDTWPDLPHTDLGFPGGFMVVACILTMRRIIASAAALSSQVRTFLGRAEKVAIFFIVFLSITAILTVQIDEAILAVDAAAALFGVLILPTIWRASRLLQSLLPNTQSAHSKAVIIRNVLLLRAILVHAFALIVLIAAIAIIGRNSDTILSWNIVYSLETVMIMSLNMELVLMTGRSVHDKSHHHHTHRMIHATSPPLQIQPSRLHSRHQSFHHSRHHSRGDALHGTTGGTTNGGHSSGLSSPSYDNIGSAHTPHGNGNGGSDTPNGTGSVRHLGRANSSHVAAPTNNNNNTNNPNNNNAHNSSHRYLARAFSVRVAPLPSPSIDGGHTITPSPLTQNRSSQYHSNEHD